MNDMLALYQAIANKQCISHNTYEKNEQYV